MEVWPTENISRKTVLHPCTEKVFLGHLFEASAESFCRKSKFRILGRNIWLGRYEADIVAYDKLNRTIAIVEVRGRQRENFLPSRCLSPRKSAKLKTIARLLSAKYQLPAKCYLVEVIGRLPPRWLGVRVALFIARRKPEWLGFQWRAWILEG